jgi:hypothetical protein
MRKFKFFTGYSKPTLVARWDSDVEDEINFLLNLDVDVEMTNFLGEEISRTIDGEIINLMRNINGGFNV